eukprot:snap_masked-scaffold_31-processed-gene-1.20-mRNA-1 protein AED:0.14 eAED:0.14 QI:0/0/0/0.33/1/1/3/0/474
MSGKSIFGTIVVVQFLARVVSGQNCVEFYDQCGGLDFTGETTCCDGSSCTYQNDYYSQCVPNSEQGSTDEECAILYAQCAGIGYIGTTTCCEGNFCQYQDDYYSQCRPNSEQETTSPTFLPTNIPSEIPTYSPTKYPTGQPTQQPLTTPTSLPTETPSTYPTRSPTNNPTNLPSQSPTLSPTEFPTTSPSSIPTKTPSKNPTGAPSSFPSRLPTESPTEEYSSYPTGSSTNIPTNLPTYIPTSTPTNLPSKLSTNVPSSSPTKLPTLETSSLPSTTPSASPTDILYSPSLIPTQQPTLEKSETDSDNLTSPTASDITPSQSPTSSIQTGADEEVDDQLSFSKIAVLFISFVILSTLLIMFLTLQIFKKTKKKHTSIMQNHPNTLIKIASRSSETSKISRYQVSVPNSVVSGLSAVGPISTDTHYISNAERVARGSSAKGSQSKRVKVYLSPEAKRSPTPVTSRYTQECKYSLVS